MARRRGRKHPQDGALPPFDVEQGPWPCEQPGCLACELTPEQWKDVMRMVFDEGKDVYIIDDKGGWYPLELRHVTTGENALTKMLRKVKRGAREDASEGHAHHSHTAILKSR